MSRNVSRVAKLFLERLLQQMEDLDVDERSPEPPAKRIKQEEKDDQLFGDEKGKEIRTFFDIASN